MQYPCRHAIAANRILKFKTDVKEWYEYASDNNLSVWFQLVAQLCKTT